jgi:hypothetical protein
MRTRLEKGDVVRIACPTADVGRGPLDAMVVLASDNGEALAVVFDGILDGCISMMPLYWQDGTFRSLLTNRPIELHVIIGTGDEVVVEGERPM